MSDKYSIDDVARIVRSEGLGYAIQHSISADRIESRRLAELWDEAAALLDNIEGWLQLEDEEH